MMKRAVFALGAVVWAMSLSACFPECRVDNECGGGTCVDNVCVPDDRPMTCTSGRVQCSASEVCDTDGECKTCTATQGCSAEEVCNTAANNGNGQCVTCTATLGCGSAEICDPDANSGTGACVTCLADGNQNCDPSSSTPICDGAANDGAGACVTCTAELGCLQGVCDTAANGGAGQCVTCVSNENCTEAGATQCDTSTGTCVECLNDEQCTDPAADYCSAGTCAACRDSAEGSGQDLGCSAGLPMCDATTVTCREPTCEEDAAYCPQCADNAGCAANLTCNAEFDCEAPATNATIDAQIQAFIDAAAGAVSLPIDGAVVTYLKPQASELGGFFVQGNEDGPGMFVQVDPVTVAVGDRVSFTVTNKTITGGMDIADTISALTVISSGHPVTELAPVGFRVDVSSLANAADVETYESELVKIEGTLPAAASFGFGGAGYSVIQIETAGVTGNTSLRVRMPNSVILAKDVEPGCAITLFKAIGWHFNTTQQITAELAGDVAVSNCPVPTLVSAHALSATSVEVRFSRSIDGATVDPADFAIPGATILSAEVSATKPRSVVLTLAAALVAGTRYSVDVAVDSVSDTLGATNAVGSANFWGFAPAPTGLVINELEADDPSTDDAEFIELFNSSAVPVNVGGLQILAFNGADSAPGFRTPYMVVTLSGAVDSAGNPTDTIPAGGYMVVGAQTTVLDTISSASVIEMPGMAGVQNGPDGVGLFDYASGTKLDGLFYESNVGGAWVVESGTGFASVDFAEGANAPDDTSASSLQRTPNGTDTNVNSADFTLKAPSPGAPTP